MAASILTQIIQQQHVSRTPATVSSMTTALPPKDNQQLPSDLPSAPATPPAYLQQANAPATKRG